MNIKTIVKVMNFHALLRVDRAHRDADQYQMLEREVSRMIGIIENNRNFILDQWIQIPKKGAPRLRIYIGSDLGFCGAANASVNSMLEKDDPANTIVTIGRKLRSMEQVDLRLTREEFSERYNDLERILSEGIRQRRYSGVDLCYDHYYNMTHIEPVERTIFPIEKGELDEYETYSEDFSVEGGSINELMDDLIVTYLNFEVKSAAVNAFASENILRQNATNESLKKLDEMEAAAENVRRKHRNELAARKVIDSYTKKKYRSR